MKSIHLTFRVSHAQIPLNYHHEVQSMIYTTLKEIADPVKSGTIMKECRVRIISILPSARFGGIEEKAKEKTINFILSVEFTWIFEARMNHFPTI